MLPDKLKGSFLFPSRVIELTGDVTPDMKSIAKADLIVTTPEKWDGVSRSWQNRNYVKQVTILIIDEIHLLGGYHCIGNQVYKPGLLYPQAASIRSWEMINMHYSYFLGEERGPVLEVIVSRTNFISSHTEKPVRIVGLSTALANARDLADWLNIRQVCGRLINEAFSSVAQETVLRRHYYIINLNIKVENGFCLILPVDGLVQLPTISTSSSPGSSHSGLPRPALLSSYGQYE